MDHKTKRHSPKCRRPRKKRKRQYRIRNWKEYNQALVQRGSLTVWVEEPTLAHWFNHERSGRPGKPCLYSELAMSCMATLQVVYHLPLRATQGLLGSLMQLLSKDLAVPDYSTLCRRRQKLAVSLPRLPKSGPLHLDHIQIGKINCST